MRRFVYVPTFAALAGLLALPAVLAGQPVFPRGSAQIVGTVVDSSTGRAIIRTRICREVDLRAPYGRGIRCATPDSLGRFSLDSLPEDRQVVTVTCSGERILDVRLLRQDTITLGPGAVTRIDVRTDAAECDMRPFIERRGEFTGYYRFGFEESAFTPCGESVSAWVTFGPQAAERHVVWPKQNDPYYPSYFVRWTGTLRGPWHYGHLGVSQYEVVVDRILEVRHPGRRTACKH
jgi:hypothetical protein